MSLSRRNFIKSVIAGGAVTSSVGYLFRSSGVLGQTSTAPGSVERLITLNVNGQMRRVDVLKQETLAMTLRYKLGLTGTKNQDFIGISINPSPDYAMIARAFDGYGEKVEEPGEVRAALQRGLKAVAGGQMTLIDIRLAKAAETNERPDRAN